MASRTGAYGSLLALQGKVVWEIWRWKDLAAGDTSQYYVGASRWAGSLATNPVWSPLFLIVYGSLRRLLADPFTTTTVLRLALVAVLVCLVLAVLRSLLPPGIAWLTAAWFALVPVNFDTLYEVHLFAALPTLVAVALVARVPGHRGRAAVLGILAGSTLLVRNEIIIATGLWALLCLWRDGPFQGRRGARPGRSAVLGAYAAALLIVAGLSSLVWVRSPYDVPTVRVLLHRKHTLNVCQIYAFGHAQRHPEWTASPWTECQGLMRRTFGNPEPTMAEALRAEPRAMVEHFAWNGLLVPAGLQLQLFGAISGGPTPDYVQVPVRPLAAWLFAVAAALVVAGAALAWRESWVREWLRGRAAPWALLACLVATSAVVMLVQRPRPSYLFPQAVALHAVVGMAVCILASRWRLAAPLERLAPVAALALLALAPSYYGPDTPQAFGQRGQPLRRAVERLAPFGGRLASHDQRLLAAGFGSEICNYVGGATPCTAIALASGGAEEPGAALVAQIEAGRVDWVYVDETAWMQPDWQAMLERLTASPSWRRLAPAEADARWALLHREESPP